MSGPRPWSEPEDRLLAALLDEIIPASADGRVPAAGELGITEFLASRAADDPELATLLRNLLTRAEALGASRGARFEALDASGRITIVEALEREAPDAFTALLWHTYMGYYSRADVRPHFGLSPRPTQPEGYVLPEDDPDELADMLASVRAQGRRYRPT